MFSIYETKLKLNEDLVAVKDSELMSCNRSYRQMQDLVKEQSLREQQLTEDLNTVLKQQKKKKFQNRLIAAGMLLFQESPPRYSFDQNNKLNKYEDDK